MWWRSCTLIKHEDIILTHYLALGTFPHVKGVEKEVIFLQEDITAVCLMARSIRRLLCSQDVILKTDSKTSINSLLSTDNAWFWFELLHLFVVFHSLHLCNSANSIDSAFIICTSITSMLM